MLRNFETCRGFVFPHVTCLQEICVQLLQGWVSGMFAVLLTMEKRIYNPIFISLATDTTHMVVR